jgi:hypothetical protein
MLFLYHFIIQFPIPETISFLQRNGYKGANYRSFMFYAINRCFFAAF